LISTLLCIQVWLYHLEYQIYLFLNSGRQMGLSFGTGVQGGVVDLASGSLMAARPEQRITKQTAVSPAPVGTAHPIWDAFLNEATGGDVHLIGFLKRWFGYCLTGVTVEHALMFVHGDGGNGKSVLLNTITGILGDYAATAVMESLTSRRFEGHTTDLAMLAGARIVTASETEQGKAWAEARFKQLTGGDPITARFMRQDNFTYQPQFKLTVIGNHAPELRSVDNAMRRRFNVVSFNRKPANVDKQLGTKLWEEEGPAILRWMIDGCIEWQEKGLQRPASVEAATAEYFATQDTFTQWVEEQCKVDPGNAEYWGGSTPMYENYTAFVRARGEKVPSHKAWAEMMKQAGYKNNRTHSKGRHYLGIKCPSEEPSF
jgi:putative DNA primase/helicase